MATSTSAAAPTAIPAPDIESIDVDGAQATILGLLAKTSVGRLDSDEARQTIEHVMMLEGFSPDAIESSAISITARPNRPAIATITCADSESTILLMPTHVGNERTMRVTDPVGKKYTLHTQV